MNVEQEAYFIQCMEILRHFPVKGFYELRDCMYKLHDHYIGHGSSDRLSSEDFKRVVEGFLDDGQE